MLCARLFSSIFITFFFFPFVFCFFIAPNVLSARDKGKSHVNDVSGVITLDDLLGEKTAVQKSCSTSITFPVGKNNGSEGNTY